MQTICAAVDWAWLVVLVILELRQYSPQSTAFLSCQVTVKAVERP
ncbi:hypothetical protein [Synechococcus sp. UW69]|nr:hypothetical protein [Synechococcus sp. UW69]